MTANDDDEENEPQSETLSAIGYYYYSVLNEYLAN